jgi:hypothetical protein
MKVLHIKTDGRVKAVRFITGRDNELTPDDIKKLMPSRAGIVLAAKISRLAYLYVMFVEKDAASQQLPTNILATRLTNEDAGLIRGDVILARTNHFGSGSKYFTLEDNEISGILERMSKLYGSEIELLSDTGLNKATRK